MSLAHDLRAVATALGRLSPIAVDVPPQVLDRAPCDAEHSVRDRVEIDGADGFRAVGVGALSASTPVNPKEHARTL